MHERLHITPLSHLSDEEFLRHLLTKGEPTTEDVEAALRLELLMGSYSALLERIHTTSRAGLGDSSRTREALSEIHELTAAAN